MGQNMDQLKNKFSADSLVICDFWGSKKHEQIKQENSHFLYHHFSTIIVEISRRFNDMLLSRTNLFFLYLKCYHNRTLKIHIMLYITRQNKIMQEVFWMNSNDIFSVHTSIQHLLCGCFPRNSSPDFWGILSFAFLFDGI